MASIAAVNSVGDSIVALLRARRDLLAADGLLGPVPAALDVNHVSLSRLTTQAVPTAGLTLCCMRIAMSEHPRPRTARASLAVELHYMLTSWSATAIEEQSILAWAMLELSATPVLDASVLVGAGIWERDETVQIVPDDESDDALYRIWLALQMKYRLSTAFRARVIRIGYGDAPVWPNVVATRFAVTDAV